MSSWISHDPAPNHRVNMTQKVRPVRRIHVMRCQLLSGEIKGKAFGQAWASRPNEYGRKPLQSTGRAEWDGTREGGRDGSCVVSRSLLSEERHETWSSRALTRYGRQPCGVQDTTACVGEFGRRDLAPVSRGRRGYHGPGRISLTRRRWYREVLVGGRSLVVRLDGL